MEDSMRGPLIVAEVVALGVILALVENTLLRVALGLLVGLLLARGALTTGAAPAGQGPPAGLHDRRQDHLFRHWVNILLKKIREFHTVCQGVAEGGVNLAVGQLRIHEIEREITDLMNQVTESAKPAEIKKGRRGRGPVAPEKKRPEG
ncbi:MAG: hypothetical protein AMS25_08820 [Gemmatimonas sp. SM23_52]|nr:MAG: hypothetical protein AMS25_08820 [Gemmatimonas sp. SM23_52]